MTVADSKKPRPKSELFCFRHPELVQGSVPLPLKKGKPKLILRQAQDDGGLFVIISPSFRCGAANARACISSMVRYRPVDCLSGARRSTATHLAETTSIVTEYLVMPYLIFAIASPCSIRAGSKSGKRHRPCHGFPSGTCSQ